jgi:AraC-like DNA-binding protein
MSRPLRRRVRLEAVEHHGDYDHAPRPIAAMAKAFPEGSSTSVHRHGRGQLLHAVSGVMRIETPYAAWLVPPARALWMPPHEVHRVTMRGHVEMRTLYIEPGANLDGWASRAGASRRTLARLFRGETGLSFAEWRARLRAGRGERGRRGIRQPERVLRDGAPTARRAAATLGPRRVAAAPRQSVLRAEHDDDVGGLGLVRLEASRIGLAPVSEIDHLGRPGFGAAGRRRLHDVQPTAVEEESVVPQTGC